MRKTKIISLLYIIITLIGQTAIIQAQNNPSSLTSLEELGDYLTTETNEGRFSGVVLLARDGEILFEEAYGYASKRYLAENNVQTKFNIGSISKHLTSIAVLQLVEQGLLDVDDTIGKYLDGFADSIADNVTIRHLLTMTSGWGDYWENEYYLAHRNDLRSVSEYLEFIKDIPLDFEPGSSRQHCNTGFEVAGAIIEKVSGMDYYDYIRENIYKPAGMLNSDSYYRDGPVKNIATGYTNMSAVDELKKDYQWSNIYTMLPHRGTPTGGSYSTAEDLLKLDQAQRSFRLLSEDYTTFLLNLLQGEPGDPFMMNKGILHISGGAPGVGAMLGLDMMDPDLKKGFTIIILSNYDFPVTIEVFEKIKDLVFHLKKEGSDENKNKQDRAVELFRDYLRKNWDDIHDVIMRFHYDDPFLAGTAELEMEWKNGILAASSVKSNTTGNPEFGTSLIEAMSDWHIEGLPSEWNITIPFRTRIYGSDNPEFQNSGIFTGKVLNKRGIPLKSAKLILKPDGIEDAVTDTIPVNREGVFIKTLLKPGKWRVTCVLPDGSTVIVSTIKVSPGEHVRKKMKVKDI